ncbi:MAG: hypothetical protein IAE85_02980 [Anaerolinea sp.]|nr:hypothetical protein [Anaerolinea sp.]
MAPDLLQFPVEGAVRWLLRGLLLLWAGSAAQMLIVYSSAAALAALSGQ